MVQTLEKFIAALGQGMLINLVTFSRNKHGIRGFHWPDVASPDFFTPADWCDLDEELPLLHIFKRYEIFPVS